MGSIHPVPDDLSHFYTGNYYKSAAGGSDSYVDYASMAEHGVGWAAAVIEALQLSGSILDIGCADGYLLKKLCPPMRGFGIEVNEQAAESAKNSGVEILAHDLFDPALTSGHLQRFDVITSIATFEHLRDFRGGVELALSLLKPDGVMLFEIPLISTEKPNNTWYTSSFEHVYYPTVQAIERLFHRELDCSMLGKEIWIEQYAAPFVGLAARERNSIERYAERWQRIINAKGQPQAERERRARAFLHTIHAANSDPDMLGCLGSLHLDDFNTNLRERLIALWKRDVGQLQQIETARDYHAEQVMNWQRVAEQSSSNFTEVEAKLRAELKRSDDLQIKYELERSERQRLQSVENKRAEALKGTSEKLNQPQERELSNFRVKEDQAYAAQLLEARDFFADQAKRWEAAYNKALDDSKLAQASITAISAAEITELRRQIDLLHDGLGRRILLALKTGLRVVRHPVLSTKLAVIALIQVLGRFDPDGARRLEQRLRQTWWHLTGQSVRSPHPLLDPRPIAEHMLTEPQPNNANAQEISVYDNEPHLGAPLVSIVIPCFNYGRFVGDAVQSALAQTFSEIEVIVVDGGSTDGTTPKVVSALEGGNVKCFLREQANRVGSNRNYGIERARGKYICCLDADDRLEPTYVEKAVFLLEHYGYDVVSSAVQMFGLTTERYDVAEQPTLELLLNHNEMATCGLFRKALWKEVGGYRDHGDGSAATHIHEDWEFWIRLAAAGGRFFNIANDYLFLYRQHGSTSLSQRVETKPINEQRKIIREMNGDVITEEAIEASTKRCLAPLKARDPLVNLRPNNTNPDGKSLLVFLPWIVLGGAERLLSRIFKHLKSEGWSISIVTTLVPNPADGDTTEWFRQSTDHIYELSRFLNDRNRWRDFIDYLVIRRRISRILIAGSAFAYEALPNLKAKFPYLNVFDLLFNTVGHTANNRTYADYIDCNLVENTEVRRWLLDHGESEERIKIIPSGVDLPVPLPTEGRDQFRAALGAHPDHLVVGFSGRWSPEKDPVGFIEIAERVAGSPVMPVHFVMTGAGRLEDGIARRLAASPQLRNCFHLLGHVADLSSVLSAYDILVLPSTVDGRPIVVLEALAAGVPVVASDVGGLPELVLPGVNGFLCKPQHYAGFAEVVGRIVEDRELLAKLKHGARRFAEENLGANAMVRAYENALSSHCHRSDFLKGDSVTVLG